MPIRFHGWSRAETQGALRVFNLLVNCSPSLSEGLRRSLGSQAQSSCGRSTFERTCVDSRVRKARNVGA